MNAELTKKLQNPAVQKALGFWADRAATLLMLGKSERQVKYWIQRSMDVYGTKLSHHGLEIIWQMAAVKAEEIKMRSLPIIIQSTNGNS